MSRHRGELLGQRQRVLFFDVIDHQQPRQPDKSGSAIDARKHTRYPAALVMRRHASIAILVLPLPPAASMCATATRGCPAHQSAI